MATVLVILAIVIVIVAVVIVMLFQMVERNAATADSMKAKLVERFGDGDYHVRLPGPRCIGLAWEREELILGEALGDDPGRVTAIPFASMRAVNIDIDGAEVTTSRSTTSTNRGSQALGSAIGALALGPAGLLVGGLTGSTTTTGKAVAERKVRSIKLIVRVADRQAPLRSFTFFDAGYGEGYEASHPLVSPELDKAAHFHALLTQVIEDRSVSEELGERS